MSKENYLSRIKDLPENVIAIGNPAIVVAKRCLKCLDKIKLLSEGDLCENCNK